MKAPLPLNESSRLKLLKMYNILDTEFEKCFDDLTNLAAVICDTPMSAISLIDENRQWFKSRFGISATETPLEVSFCSHTILQNDIFVVEDATKDKRFFDNPLVESSPNIRFYAGAPLNVNGDFKLGALCVIDTKPRILTEKQLNALNILRDAVVTQLEMRRALIDIKAFEQLLPICAWCRNIRTESGSWQSMNEYVADSNSVSHSICPGCKSMLEKSYKT